MAHFVSSWFGRSVSTSATGVSPSGPQRLKVRRPRLALEGAPAKRPHFTPSNQEAVTSIPGARLKRAQSWACQFQKIDVAAIVQCSADVVVIDSGPDGEPDRPFKPVEVEAMRQGHSGPKTLIAYMSIGEAEQNRFYWNKSWCDKHCHKTRKAPPWLDRLNADGWEGNWSIRFWDSGWQANIIDRPDSFLNRIIDQGFDGVFLDVIDAFIYWSDTDRGKDRRETAGQDMIAFVSRIAEHARVVRNKPDFLIMPLNGDALLQDANYRAVISVVAKEDVLFRMVGRADAKPKLAERPRTGEDGLDQIMRHLRQAQADSIPILDLEYILDWPKDAAQIPTLVPRMRALGLVPHFTHRALGELCPVVPVTTANVS